MVSLWPWAAQIARNSPTFFLRHPAAFYNLMQPSPRLNRQKIDCQIGFIIRSYDKQHCHIAICREEETILQPDDRQHPSATRTMKTNPTSEKGNYSYNYPSPFPACSPLETSVRNLGNLCESLCQGLSFFLQLFALIYTYHTSSCGDSSRSSKCSY